MRFPHFVIFAGAVPAMPSSLIVLSAGQLGRGAPALAGSAPQELLEALAQVPDPRDRRGIRYGLAPVLGVAVRATLAGRVLMRRSRNGLPTPRRGCAPGWGWAALSRTW